MQAPGPTLTTPRLILRPPASEDFEAWATMVADEEAMRFIGHAQPRATAWRAFLGTAGAWALQGFGMFSVIERASGRWVGRIGPIHPEGWPGTEVGWGLARDAWGQGYAVEAAAAAMDFAVDTLGWRQIIHCIDRENTPSQAVARRLGSTVLRADRLPPPIPPEEAEVEVWGQSAAQWRARRTG